MQFKTVSEHIKRCSSKIIFKNRLKYRGHRCQMFAVFETASEYINSSVEKSISHQSWPNIPTSRVGNEDDSKGSSDKIQFQADSCCKLISFLVYFCPRPPQNFYSLANLSSRHKNTQKLSFPCLHILFQAQMKFPSPLVLKQSDGDFQSLSS